MLFRSHIRAYHCWIRQESGHLCQEAWQQEELAARKQEEAWAIAQQQKRVRLEAELRDHKNNNTTPAKPMPQATMPTVALRKPHVVMTTVFQQIQVDKEEKCEGPACGGRGKAAWVLNTQEFDKEEEDLIEIKFFICNTCNDKHKKKFDMHTIISHTPCIVKTKKVSKEVISWMSSELTTLLDVLLVVSKDIRKVLLDTISNQIMLWDLAGEKALTHFRKVLSIEERNQLMHTLNSNILGCIRAREYNSAEWNDSDWEHVQLHCQD